MGKLAQELRVWGKLERDDPLLSREEQMVGAGENFKRIWTPSGTSKTGASTRHYLTWGFLLLFSC